MLTGEPDAVVPPVRFGGRGGAILRPYPYQLPRWRARSKVHVVRLLRKMQSLSEFRWTKWTAWTRWTTWTLRTAMEIYPSQSDQI